MKKSQKVLWLIIVISIYIYGAKVFLDVSGLWPTPTQNPQDARLNSDLAKLVSRYQKRELSVIDLSSITPFAWDRVHLFAKFPEFMDEKDMDSILGKSWRDIESCNYAAATSTFYVRSDNDSDRNYRQDSGYSLFIFTHENAVVYCMIYVDTPAAHVYINSTDIKKGIPLEKAFFLIDSKGIIRPIVE